MAQIAPIQPNLTPPPPPGGTSPAGGEQQAFSPHLQKALNDRTSQNGPDNSPNNSSGSTTADKGLHRDGEKTSTEPVIDQLDHQPTQPAEIGSENLFSLTSFETKEAIPSNTLLPERVIGSETAKILVSEKSAFSQEIISALWSRRADSLATPTLSAAFSEGHVLPAPFIRGQASQIVLFPQASDSAAMSRFTDARAGQFPANQANLAFAVGDDAQPLTGGEGKSANHRDSLLSQLQQIIANSSETGRVAITASQQTSANTAASVSPSLSTVGQFVGINSNDINSFGTTTEKPGQQFPGLRQNIHQQYYEAKLSQFFNQNGGSEEQQPQNETGRQPALLTAAAAMLASPGTAADSGTTFHQTLMTGQEPAPLLASEPGRAIPLPGATQVHDQQVMQQLIERFQLNKRPLETHINIRLQPAELGTLKIDLTVSEGSIRASVVAQNQQVQEIIERNLARLRSILEGQGFTIDSLVVTSESETIDQFTHFDSRPFQHGTVPDELKATGRPAASTVDFDQLVTEDIKANQVVNLKI
jgi:flagellar hook-length control protein FliK